MKVIVCPDSFKGSLSAVNAANAIEAGLKKASEYMEVEKIPMADGGEGTVEALVMAAGGTIIPCEVTGPLGDRISSFYGVLNDGKTAVIEMAAASGLTLVPLEKRNPMVTTTFGTGELIRIAAEQGCKKILIGIGGSATNDGGMGMAQALGVNFYDRNGNKLGTGAKELTHIADIDMSSIYDTLRNIEIQVACDVTNTLCGSNGASFIYAHQKGATPDMIIELDEGLSKYADVIAKKLSVNIKDIPGSGAAGGLGGGLMAFLNAKLTSGIDFMIDASKMKEKVKKADLVITGEGQTDKQTSFGKVPIGIAKIAAGYGTPVICLSGSLGDGYEDVYRYGITGIFSIINRPMALPEAMDNAALLLEQSARSIGRMYLNLK